MDYSIGIGVVLLLLLLPPLFLLSRRIAKATGVVNIDLAVVVAIDETLVATVYSNASDCLFVCGCCCCCCCC